jgi:cytochrome P450
VAVNAGKSQFSLTTSISPSSPFLDPFPGADTAAMVLTFAFFYLLSEPPLLSLLRSEIQTAVPDSAHIDDAALVALPLLTQVLEESLRLGTPLSGLPRVVPLGGSVIDDEMIPGGTVVSVPAYAQEVSEDNW